MTSITTRTTVRVLAGALVVGVVAVAGCSSSGSPSSSSTSGAASTAKVPLVVYSAQGYDHDADLRERMRVEISSLVREAGATAVYITHDQAEAFALADQIGLLQAGGLVQFGRPEEIYTEPASPFVARFTRLSGELTVRSDGRAADADGTVEIGSSGPLLRSCRARVSGGHVPGGDATLLIRPTALALCGTHDGENHLAGPVADVAFRGRGYEHAIDIPGHGRLTGTFAPVRSERGESVGLRLDPAGCYLFSATEAPATDDVTVGPGPSPEDSKRVEGARLVG
jgi:iron(III) transport system ATP-binding protein